MRLNADIIYQNLKNYIEVSFNGDSVRELVLLRPEFYLDGQKEFLSGHVYVCSADHLPEEPAIEENVLLICLGSRTPTAFFYRGCSILSVPEDENIFRVFNLVQDVFNRYEAWEGRLNEVLRGSASLQEMLDLSKDIFNNPLLTDEDAWEAARLAAFDGDIRKFPLGMDTPITVDGKGVSGGQRQRILIARALVRKPTVLFSLHQHCACCPILPFSWLIGSCLQQTC